MKKNLKQSCKLIIGILLVALGIIILGASSLEFIKLIRKLFDKYPEISVALITGMLAFLSVVIGKYMENKYNSSMSLKEKKSEVYLKFLNWIIDNNLNRQATQNSNLVAEIRDKQKELTIFASDKVLKAWMDFRVCLLKLPVDFNEWTQDNRTKYYIERQAPYLEKLILAIRKELGYKNKNIEQYDILRMYINDIDDYI